MVEADILDAVNRALRSPEEAALAEARQRLAAAAAPIGALQALDGEILRRRGAIQQAAILLEQAIAALPELHAAYHAAALAAVAAGKGERARAIWLALLQRDGDDPIARYQIGLTLHDAGALGEAAHWYDEQVRRRPDFLPAWYNLGLAALALRDAPRAWAAFEVVTAGDPRHRKGWIALGKARHADGDAHRAVDAWLAADRLPGQDAEPLTLAAAALVELHELPAAVDLLDRAIAIEPRNVRLLWARGSHLSNLGQHAAALTDFRAALALDPDDWRGESRLLLELHYDDALVAPAALAAAHHAWSARHLHRVVRYAPAVSTLPEATTRTAGATRAAAAVRLRIGYLSPRFGAGPLANLFMPVLAARDRHATHVTLYSAWAHHDPLAARMRAAADAWRELPLDDDAAAALIAADHLDVLIDLAGHAPGHRLHVLARKPAPVQVSWLDYFDTTGVDAVDYLLSDPVHTPASDASRFCERLVLLPGCRFVYAPVVEAPPSPAPRVRNGHVTFGSFNRHAKITPAMLDAWRAILERVPDARLRLRSSAYRGPGTVRWTRERWQSMGLPIERIHFEPYVPLEDAIRAYEQIDVALDTAPYNGGITTCDALAAGVPVVTTLGDRMIARQSAALLQAAGRPEWIAATLEGYVNLAVDLAQSPQLPAIRAALLADLPCSPLMDVVRFTKTFEHALRTLATLGPRTGSAAPPLVIAP
ncbi:MAG: glycosyltransferase [Casimicrobiaceae bacterium]